MAKVLEDLEMRVLIVMPPWYFWASVSVLMLAVAVRLVVPLFG